MIELLVVMAIIGLLASIVAPRYFRQVDRARESVLKQQLHAMRDAIDKFQSDQQRYPTALTDLVSQHYLRAVPSDPVTERSDTWIVVQTTDPAGGIFDVKSGAPGLGPDGRPYAEW